VTVSNIWRPNIVEARTPLKFDDGAMRIGWPALRFEARRTVAI